PTIRQRLAGSSLNAVRGSHPLESALHCHQAIKWYTSRNTMQPGDLEANPSDERGHDATRGLHEDELAPTVAMGAAEVDGSVIDRYRLIQKIGEGGMGEVWLAEQKEPVRRRVALKLVKAGMNGREVIARFESERQALAVMNHPAIARVLDAGSTPHA